MFFFGGGGGGPALALSASDGVRRWGRPSARGGAGILVSPSAVKRL